MFPLNADSAVQSTDQSEPRIKISNSIKESEPDTGVQLVLSRLAERKTNFSPRASIWLVYQLPWWLKMSSEVPVVSDLGQSKTPAALRRLWHNPITIKRLLRLFVPAGTNIPLLALLAQKSPVSIVFAQNQIINAEYLHMYIIYREGLFCAAKQIPRGTK